jgi:hypothetical protein
MHMAVVKSGHDRFAFCIHHMRVGADEFFHPAIASDKKNFIAAHGHGFRARLFRIHSDDVGVANDEISNHVFARSVFARGKNENRNEGRQNVQKIFHGGTNGLLAMRKSRERFRAKRIVRILKNSRTGLRVAKSFPERASIRGQKNFHTQKLECGKNLSVLGFKNW